MARLQTSLSDSLARMKLERVEPFRELSRELEESPASLAHRYALSMDGIDTVVLGVKTRAEPGLDVEIEAIAELG